MGVDQIRVGDVDLFQIFGRLFLLKHARPVLIGVLRRLRRRGNLP